MFDFGPSMEEQLNNKIYVGIVEENIDPKRLGRVKIRVQSIFDNPEKIPTENIPWAHPFNNKDGKEFMVPPVGKIVNVIFPNGDVYNPEYIYSQIYNINLQNKLGDLSDDEYKNFVALLFDHRTQIYSDDDALTLDYYYNYIKLRNKSIDVVLKDRTNTLNLGYDVCNQDAVLGTNFFKWFDSFMEVLSVPNNLTGNLGAPVLRPAVDLKIQEYKRLRPTFVSDNVKIVNNNTIKKKK